MKYDTEKMRAKRAKSIDNRRETVKSRDKARRAARSRKYAENGRA
jgi:hypothetical protein